MGVKFKVGQRIVLSGPQEPRDGKVIEAGSSAGAWEDRYELRVGQYRVRMDGDPEPLVVHETDLIRPKRTKRR